MVTIEPEDGVVQSASLAEFCFTIGITPRKLRTSYRHDPTRWDDDELLITHHGHGPKNTTLCYFNDMVIQYTINSLSVDAAEQSSH